MFAEKKKKKTLFHFTFFSPFTIGSVFDNGIQLWDLKRPFFPISTLLGHKDITASFLWHHDSPDVVISASKDCRLLYHDVRKAYHLIRDLRSTGISWSVSGRLALLNDKVQRGPDDGTPALPMNAPPPPPSPIVSTQSKVDVGERKLSTLLFGGSTITPQPTTGRGSMIGASSTSSTAHLTTTQMQQQQQQQAAVERGVAHIYEFHPVVSDFDEGQVLQCLAQNYRYSGASLEDICTHNAQVARHVERHQIAQTWLILRLLYGEAQRPSVSVLPAAPTSPMTTTLTAPTTTTTTSGGATLIGSTPPPETPKSGSAINRKTGQGFAEVPTAPPPPTFRSERSSDVRGFGFFFIIIIH